jgi:hypothetical protein
LGLSMWEEALIASLARFRVRNTLAC